MRRASGKSTSYCSRVSFRVCVGIVFTLLPTIAFAQNGKRPKGFQQLPVDANGVATTPVGERFERAENLLKQACPKEAARADRARKKRQEGETGVGDVDGGASTKPNSGDGSAGDPWKWDKNDPSNTVQVNGDEFTATGEYNPAMGFGPTGSSGPTQTGPTSDAAQDLMLSSALLHEDVHCNQDGEEVEDVPIPDTRYKNEVVAHEKQLAYIVKALAFLVSINQIEIGSVPEKRLRWYVVRVRADKLKARAMY